MRLFSALLIISGMCSMTGCSMCATGYLDDYATVGGKWQRGDPVQGRVGSPFSNAGETISGELSDGQYSAYSGPSVEGEVVGEAYTESYDQGMEEYQEFGELSPDQTYHEVSPGDGELILSDGW